MSGEFETLTLYQGQQVNGVEIHFQVVDDPGTFIRLSKSDLENLHNTWTMDKCIDLPKFSVGKEDDKHAIRLDNIKTLLNHKRLAKLVAEHSGVMLYAADLIWEHE
ncbi:hypothetical protein LTS08_002797 [Lithohypha guttulata]|nr:hypothetical protein LTS08_002797 [Lithohypha guttulata]